MKRNLGLALIAIFVVVLTVLLLPTSLAKRNESSVKHSNPKNAPIFSDLLGAGREIDTDRSINLKGMGDANRNASEDQKQDMIVGTSYHNDESPSLREMPLLPMKAKPEHEANENPSLPTRHVDSPDPVIQDSFASLRGLLEPNVMPSPILNFDGILFPGVACNCAPPDTNGEVGPTQYVQMVNEGFQVFDKSTGASVFGPAGITTLWTGFGGVCENNGDGDPVVVYDQLADRWIITQFAGPSVPTDECIAVSTTGDAAGSYFRYGFNLGTNFFDYPKLGVWPDAYYMSMNVFNTAGTAFLGPQPFAFDRTAMLTGSAATFVTPGITGGPTEDSYLPADVDGLSLPPLGAPELFVEFPGGGTYKTFYFHVDFVTPANSTFTLHASPTAAGFTELCAATRQCIPQLGVAAPTNNLDGIGDRLMFRLPYRNIGGVESVVGNYSVSAGGVSGVRWFELRNVTSGTETVFQESTYQPDTTWRWMGSAAMDNQGNLAVGYSASGATINPQIRYAGRLATDAINILSQGEAHLFDGTGSQSGTGNRWGDYSDMTVDPSDDCTFWYTQEYYSTTATFSWRTRIGNFKYPICTTSPRGTISGTITNCQTGLPVQNALVQFTGGYVRGTSAAGTYSATVTPGTYTGTATGFGLDTLTAPGLVVNDGGTVTFSGCLNGNLKQPVADTASITADSCNSNGAIDPNETITVSLGLKNTGTLSTVNLVGTLQATGGVTSPSGPQTYGVVVAGGATVFRSFTFTAGNLACGAPVVISLQLQDGPTNLGTITYNFTTGVQLVGLGENFDGVVAPALPAGWVAANASGAAPLWVTSTMTPDTSLNDAFIDDPAAVSDKLLDTPNISISSAAAQVTFRNNYNLESTFDGGVLEVSSPNINAGAFTDITNAAVGGSFVSGGYNGTISTGFSSPIAGRGAWTGSSGGYITTVANLGPNVAGQTIKLRFRMASDTSVAATGWRVDTLVVSNGFVCCGPLINAAPPPVITAESVSPANNAPDPEETVTVNLPLTNVGGNNTTSLVATLLPTGGVSGPSAPQNYGVVVHSGPAVTRPFTFTAQGTCGNNITLTLALQDGATNLGTVTFTMQLGTTSPATTSFSNTTSITIPETGTGAATGAPATPYPSNITISGLTGTISKVTVNLNGLNHTFPSDVDVLLVGPGGQNLIIMSDVIGGTDWVNINYLLDDAGAAVIPSSGAPASGTFRPTNYGTGDLFPAPAPVGPYQSPATAGSATFASVFNGTNPNGTWSLYVVDDAGVDIGTMSGGWAINITTAQPVCNTQSCNITAPTSITIPPGTCGTIVNYSPAVTFTGACGTVVVDPPSGSFFGIGKRTVLVRGTRADASFTDASFPVTVQDSETQATGLGANVTNNYCNTTVNYSAVLGAGSTTVVDAPAQTLPPPYVHCVSCPELNITTTASFTAPVTTCITMPASTDFNTFSRLRILHGEPGLVNRTISGNFSTKTICARTNTVSPFVVALDANAPTAAPAFISGQITTSDGAPLAGVTMNLSGARSAKVITDSNGNYSFRNIDTDNFYNVTPSLINYHFGPESRSFSLLANMTDAVFTATRDAVISGNAIDTPDYFVRQHYVDFLGREPDESGFNFWSDQILSCGSDAACSERRTINVSAAYFLSIEFQETGGLVDGLYRASYNRRPLYAEFMPDTGTVAQGVIVGTTDWAGQLEANKQAFVAAWVQRSEFQAAYGGLTNEGYVDTLISHTGVSFSQSERNKLVSGLNNSSSTRADVLRQIAENDRFVSAKRNETFVMMEYFGYLRRDPDESGYQFWLNKLNQFDGNFERAEMVKAFLVSGEYRQRFRL